VIHPGLGLDHPGLGLDHLGLGLDHPGLGLDHPGLGLDQLNEEHLAKKYLDETCDQLLQVYEYYHDDHSNSPALCTFRFSPHLTILHSLCPSQNTKSSTLLH